MEIVALDPQHARDKLRLPLGRDTASALAPAADCALLELGLALKEGGYRFTTTTPASHARVLSRPGKGRPSLTDIFGWSRPFAATDVPEGILTQLADAQALDVSGPAFRSNVRFSTLSDQIFVHSAFPTAQPDAVFFGPDTYRFARQISQSLSSMLAQTAQGPFRILDIGAGSGAGGLHAALLAARREPAVTLTDINRRALRFCGVNATLNGIDVRIIESNLFANVDGCFDLILANPPYLVDPLARLYRHGGGEFGFEVSLRIVEQGISRLAPGGRLLLYTGSAIIEGRDLFHEVLSGKLAQRRLEFSYEEIDPDVFGEELDHSPYDHADRIAVVSVTIDAA